MPSSRPLIKRRSAYTKRRMIIVFVMCTILMVFVMTGFTDFKTDNRKLSSFDPISDMADAPPPEYVHIPEESVYKYDPSDIKYDSNGKPMVKATPAVFDGYDNFLYAAYTIYMSNNFKGYTTGKVVAQLGMGITYTQAVYNTRIVKAGKIFTESISTSSMKSLAEQKYMVGQKFYRRKATKVSGITPTYIDNVRDISDTYGADYGLIPNELTKQVIKPHTVRSITDENAGLAKAAANAKEGKESALEFEMPDELVKGEDGYYSFTLDLDPVESTLFSRNESRTLSEASDNPSYANGYVRVTITIDDKWRPISVTTREQYDINIPGIGAMTCVSSLTEEFSDVGNADIEMPMQEYFESHIKDAGTGGEDKTEPSATDYLTQAFGKYLTGESDLDVKANITISDEDGTSPIDIKGLELSVNIGTLDIKAHYGKLYIEFKKDQVTDDEGNVLEDNSKLYLDLNDIKGYIPVSKITELIKDPAISELTSLLGDSIELPALDSLLSDDALSGITYDKADGIVSVNIPLAIGEIADIDAVMHIREDGGELIDITGTVKALGKLIKIDVRPAKNLVFAQPDASYKDFSPVLDFVPPAVNTALGETNGIKGAVRVAGSTLGGEYNVDIDAYIDRADGVNVDATVTVRELGVTIDIKFIKDTLYAKIGNIAVMAKTEDIPALIAEIGKYVKLDSGLLDSLKKLLPSDIKDWIAVLQSLDADENTLTLGARLVVVPVKLTVTRDKTSLTGLTLDTKIDMLGINAEVGIDLKVTAPEKRTVKAAGDYIDAKELTALIPEVFKYAEAEDLTLGLGGTVTYGDITVKPQLTAALGIKDGVTAGVCGSVTAIYNGESVKIDLAYVGTTAYLTIGDAKVKFDTEDTNKVIDYVKAALAKLGIELPDADISGLMQGLDIKSLIPTALDAVKSLAVKDGKLALVVNIKDSDITATLDVKTGALGIKGGILGAALDINASVETKATAIPAPKGDYVSVTELKPLLDCVLPLTNAKGVSISLDDTAIYGNALKNASVRVDFARGIKDIAAEVSFTLAGVPFEIKYVDSALYVSVNNGINLACGITAQELAALKDTVFDAAPELKDIIDGLLDSMKDGGPISDITGSPAKLLKAMPTLTHIFGKDKDNNDIVTGFSLGIDLSPAGMPLKAMFGINTEGGKLNAISIDADYDGLKAAAAFGVTLDNGGALKTVRLDALDIVTKDGKVIAKTPETEDETALLTLTATLDSIEEQKISVDGNVDYIDISELADLASPARALFESAKDAKSVTLDLNDTVLTTSDNRIINISGTAEIDFSPLAVSADITIFDGATFNGKTYALDVNVVFVDGVVYLKVKDILVSFDTTKDIDRIDGILKQFKDKGLIPEYIYVEIGKLLGTVDGTSAFDGFGQLFGKLASLKDADSIETIINTVLGESNGKGSDSVLKALLDMVEIDHKTVVTGYDGDTPITARRIRLKANVMSGVAVDIVPVADNGKIAAADLKLALGNKGLQLTTSIGYTLYNDARNISAPQKADGAGYDAADYISIVDVLEVATNLINNFTTGASVSESGDITLGDIIADISGFNFTYTGKDTKDSAGKTVKGETITVENGHLALMMLKKDEMPAAENTEETEDKDLLGLLDSYNIYIDASLDLTMSKLKDTYGKMWLRLVVSDDAAGKKTAFVDYYEHGTGKGERVSIDFDSIVDILASALRIIGIPSKNIQKIVGKAHMVDVNTSVFESMGIAGLEDTKDETGKIIKKGLKSVIIGALDKVYAAEQSIDDIKAAWKLFTGAGKATEPMEALMDSLNDTYDQSGKILVKKGILSYLNDAIARLKTDEDEKENKDKIDDYHGAVYDGKKISDVISGITLNKGEKQGENDIENLEATIDNNMTQGVASTTKDLATVSVMQSYHGENGKNPLIDGVKITNLDIGKAKIALDATLTAGDEAKAKFKAAGLTSDTVTDKFIVPAAITTSEKNKPYSNFANIKHLLFDVMNTANMKKFEIGGTRELAKNDSIRLKISAVILNIDLDIKYNAKVQLLDRAEREELGLIDEYYTVKDKYGDPVLDDNGKPVQKLNYRTDEETGKREYLDNNEPEYKTVAYIELITNEASTITSKVTPTCVTRLYFYDDIIYIDGISAWSQGSEKKVSYRDGDEWDGGLNFLKPKYKQKYSDFKYHDYNVTRVYARYTINELGYIIKNDISTFIKEFVFYLIPVSTEGGLLGRLLGTIIDNINTNGGNGSGKMGSIANIFNEYSYKDGEHTIGISLKELAGGNGALDNITLKLKGENDGDENIADNYISSMHVDTKLASVVTVALDAHLVNTDYTDGAPANRKLIPTAFTTSKILTAIDYKAVPSMINETEQKKDTHGYLFDDVVIDYDNSPAAHSYDSFIDMVLTECLNRPHIVEGSDPYAPGNAWTNIWKSSYRAYVAEEKAKEAAASTSTEEPEQEQQAA